MTFITIKQNSNDEIIVNPDCLCIAMLHFIREKVGLHSYEQIDIATMDGEVLDLQSHLRENGKQFIELRNSYYLVKVIADENEEASVSYIPVYDGPEIEKVKFTLASTANTTTRQKPGMKATPLFNSNANANKSSGLAPNTKDKDPITASQENHALNVKETHTEEPNQNKKKGNGSSNGKKKKV